MQVVMPSVQTPLVQLAKKSHVAVLSPGVHAWPSEIALGQVPDVVIGAVLHEPSAHPIRAPLMKPHGAPG